MSRSIRSLFVFLAGLGAIAFAADRIVHSSAFGIPKDFPEYWASARLNMRGQNPYDPALLLAEQRLAEPDRREAVMMWNPPPALAVYAPLAVLPVRWAALIWVCTQLLFVLASCDLLWRVYVGGHRRWLAQLVGLSFVGTWWMVAYGQNTGLIVLGLSGYLHFIRKERPVAAGAFGALTAIKPHLLAGFGALLIADAVTRRGRAGLAAGAGAILLALGLALAMNPSVIGQFVAAVRDPGPDSVPLHAWTLPVFSYRLRIGIAPSSFWVQFLPCAVASLSLVVWRLCAGNQWDWSRSLPIIVAISVLTTPYGGWIFDLPVLLVPVVWCAARLSSRPHQLAVLLVAQAAITFISFATPGGLHEYWWVTPAVILLCLLGIRTRQRDS